MPSARVLIDGPSGLVFDYAVPSGMRVVPGCRVTVPLRAKSTGGTVLAIEEQSQMGFKMREILELSDPEPLLTPALLETGRWIADYYGCRTEAVTTRSFRKSREGECGCSPASQMVRHPIMLCTKVWATTK